MASIIHGTEMDRLERDKFTFGEPAPRARFKPEHGGEQRRRRGAVHRHQRALHAAERRHRHPARDEHTESESRSRRKWATGDSEAPQGYLEIARRRREARGRDAAASPVDRDAAWRESVAERVGGEPERSAARARRAPPAAAAAIDGAVSSKTLLGMFADARGPGL